MTQEKLKRKIEIHLQTTNECIENFNIDNTTKELLEQDNELFKEILGNMNVIGSLPKDKDYWFREHEAFVTAMKIEKDKDVYEHLQKAFYWFKNRHGCND